MIKMIMRIKILKYKQKMNKKNWKNKVKLITMKNILIAK